MNNTMNFDGFAANHVESKIGFNDKDPITRTLELVIFWYPPKKRMSCNIADLLVELFNESVGISRTVICDPVED